MLNKERVLEIFRETNLLLEGHFLLTSGRHSNQYMQCARLLQYPWYTEEIIAGLADEFMEDNVDIVIGPAMGGIILAYEMARKLKAVNIFAERENGKMTLRRGFTIPAGARVLVAEDVITTGGSVRETIDIVKEQGGEVIGVALLVDRSNGKIDFGTKQRAALTTEVISYTAEECPICKEGKFPVVKPGSRNIK
ncbi:orotate phosphoribosyltransferase [Alkaliphilus peptidifermentans]|uniref:Orotate phosphoribosyltransferase n=1 Tax=Alkaliphilus peptidifermentans DSM 18978 TaxID=1120976 RepID=A0A1G5GIG0_9FIRM|nr:orotate phosphoribosyltransferase [Alkaliphilus peptidifermentans]SCY51020.1 orotate phosphoribosyltransferase [Alkaliphilus peptidifermentans DSM 18978]